MRKNFTPFYEQLSAKGNQDAKYEEDQLVSYSVEEYKNDVSDRVIKRSVINQLEILQTNFTVTKLNFKLGRKITLLEFDALIDLLEINPSIIYIDFPARYHPVNSNPILWSEIRTLLKRNELIEKNNDPGQTQELLEEIYYRRDELNLETDLQKGIWKHLKARPIRHDQIPSDFRPFNTLPTDLLGPVLSFLPFLEIHRFVQVTQKIYRSKQKWLSIALGIQIRPLIEHLQANSTKPLAIEIIPDERAYRLIRKYRSLLRAEITSFITEQCCSSQTSTESLFNHIIYRSLSALFVFYPQLVGQLLDIAIHLEQKGIALFLLKELHKIKAYDVSLLFPLASAFYLCDIEIARALLNKDLIMLLKNEVDSVFGLIRIILAVEFTPDEIYEIITLFLESGWLPNEQSSGGNTFLQTILCANLENSELEQQLICYLLKQHADPCIPYHSGNDCSLPLRRYKWNDHVFSWSTVWDEHCSISAIANHPSSKIYQSLEKIEYYFYHVLRENFQHFKHLACDEFVRGISDDKLRPHIEEFLLIRNKFFDYCAESIPDNRFEKLERLICAAKRVFNTSKPRLLISLWKQTNEALDIAKIFYESQRASKDRPFHIRPSSKDQQSTGLSMESGMHLC